MNPWAWREEKALVTASPPGRTKGTAWVLLNLYAETVERGGTGSPPGGPHLGSSPSGTHSEYPSCPGNQSWAQECGCWKPWGAVKSGMRGLVTCQVPWSPPSARQASLTGGLRPPWSPLPAAFPIFSSSAIVLLTPFRCDNHHGPVSPGKLPLALERPLG